MADSSTPIPATMTPAEAKELVRLMNNLFQKNDDTGDRIYDARGQRIKAQLKRAGIRLAWCRDGFASIIPPEARP